MARGMISGLFTGVVVVAVGVGAAAIWVEPVQIGAVAPASVPEEGTPDEGVAITPPESEVVEPEVGAEAPVVEDAPEAAETAQETAVVEPPVVEESAEVESPEPTEEVAALEPEAEPEVVVTEVEPLTPMPDAPPMEPVAEGTMPETEAVEEPEVAAVAEPDVAVVEEPEVAAVAEPEPEAIEEPVVEDLTETPAEPETDEIIAGAGEALPEAPAGEDRLGGDPEPAPPAVSSRLPRIGQDVVETPSALAVAQPLIVKNALPFQKVEGLPEMSVMLIDTGPERTEVGDIAMMPFPLSVAVDASQADAEAAIDFYRANNAEVVLIVPLPQGATATDVDVTMQAYDALLEKSVAVMMPEGSGFQSLGAGAAQMATVLGEKGLGLVSFPEGLNTGHKTAVSGDVPAGLVFRDLDAEGQAPDVIRRFLDNVAFRARNENGVIALARVRPDSLQALLEWSLGNRAQTVNLAPISSVLTD